MQNLWLKWLISELQSLTFVFPDWILSWEKDIILFTSKKEVFLWKEGKTQQIARDCRKFFPNIWFIFQMETAAGLRNIICRQLKDTDEGLRRLKI
jgi:hypothetical protein